MPKDSQPRYKVENALQTIKVCLGYGDASLPGHSVTRPDAYVAVHQVFEQAETVDEVVTGIYSSRRRIFGRFLQPVDNLREANILWNLEGSELGRTPAGRKLKRYLKRRTDRRAIVHSIPS